MEMKFLAQKKKIGTSFFVLIPRPIADFLSDEKYEFVIKESNNNEPRL